MDGTTRSPIWYTIVPSMPTRKPELSRMVLSR
jgi:hypothetical protein